MDEASDDEDDQQKRDSEDETDEDIDFESDEEEPRSGRKFMWLCLYTIKTKLNTILHIKLIFMEVK